MPIITSQIQRNSQGKKIIASLFTYWLVLVLWQNIGSYIALSSAALIIKILLMLYLAVNFINPWIRVNAQNLILWLGFFFYTLILFIVTESNLSSINVVYFFFPVIFSFMTLVCQTNAEISKVDYLHFLNLVIAIVTYMAFYSLVFQLDHFINFFSYRHSYGNELTSFFISNHEYGMYLVFAITAAIICYQNTEYKKLRLLYSALLILFCVNLVVTLSRTAFLACIVIIVMFLLISKNYGLKKWIIIIMTALILITLLLPNVREFAFNVLLKKNDDAGRFEMWRFALKMFNEGSIETKILGNGYSSIESYLQNRFSHSSFHNMFLQTLLVWGIIGTCFLIGVIVCSIKSALKIMRINRNISVIFLALTFSAIAFMFTNTACIMQSPIDSYMLTIFTIIIPRYVSNSIQSESNSTNLMEERYNEE